MMQQKMGHRTNWLTITLAIILAIAGIGIPLGVLHAQEEAIIGNIEILPVQDRQISNFEEMDETNQSVSSYQDLLMIAKAQKSWEQRIGEPLDGELQMSDAVETVKSGLNKLESLGLQSEIEFQNTNLSNAEFYVYESGDERIGLWSIDLQNSDKNDIHVQCDAETGMIVSVNIDNLESFIDAKSLSTVYIEYLGLYHSEYSEFVSKSGDRLSRCSLRVDELYICSEISPISIMLYISAEDNVQ